MIEYVFGSPGAGKTTYAVKRALDEYRRGREHVFCNFDCMVAERISLDGLGAFTLPPGSLLIIDEAGIAYNSRSFKTFPKELVAWMKLHRHYKVDVVVISQSWEDVDVTIRRLSDRLFLIKKLGPFTVVRRVFKTVGIDDSTHQIIDAYKFAKLLAAFFDRSLFSIFLRPWYYSYFDSFSAPPLPVRSASPGFSHAVERPLWWVFHPVQWLKRFLRQKLHRG